MAGPSRSKLQREHDRRRAAELSLRGLSHYEIASLPEFSHVSRRQVCEDLLVVRNRWRADAVASMATHRARLLAESDLRMRELWAAWEASKRERRSTVTRQRQLPSVPSPGLVSCMTMSCRRWPSPPAPMAMDPRAR